LPVDHRKVYLVEIEELPSQAPILAIDVEVGDDYIGFSEPGNFSWGHHCTGRLEKDLPDGLVWRRVGYQKGKPVDKGTITFRELTLEEFEKSVRPNVYGGDQMPQFCCTEELHEWYRRRFGR
jgi:hypothetical protein